MTRLLLALLLLLSAAPGQAGNVVALAMAGDSVTVELDAAVTEVRVLALAAPYRLAVDLPGIASWPRTVPGAGAVLRLRAGQFDPATARLVIELASPMRIAAATQDAGHRLTLQLVPTTAAGFAAAVRRGRVAVPLGAFDLPDDAFGTAPAAAPMAAPAAEVPLRRSGKRPLVVIDAGHGGKDVGAIAVTGGYEKDVTLAIARAAARVLRRNGRVRVKLTRDDDRFIALGERVAIARAADADLFVSIHADSAPNPRASGASVYTLSEVASDALAARLAARENKADSVAGIDFADAAPEVGDIMFDLVQRDTMNASAGFAQTLQATLQPRLAFRGEFHRFAGFRVLKAPDVPSVLFETGYVTNTDDAARLFSTAGQRAIGEGVAAAVEAYLAGR